MFFSLSLVPPRFRLIGGLEAIATPTLIPSLGMGSVLVPFSLSPPPVSGQLNEFSLFRRG